MELTAAPDILDYMDYRLFLRDRLEHLQSVDKKYSQRWVAIRAGFKAPQLLSMIVQGHRNLTKDKASDLARVLKLNERETEYLHLLVDLADTTSHEGQKALLERLKSSFRDGLFSEVPDDGIEIFRDWYYPAVREVVTLKDAKPDIPWIAERLGITHEQAGAALTTLLEKGFLTRAEDGSGKLLRAEPSVRTSRNKIYPMMLGQYHLTMLERAFGALRLPREQRHFEGLTFAIPRELTPKLKEMIQRFFREVDMMIEAHDQRDDVCHLRVELFPLSQIPPEGR